MSIGHKRLRLTGNETMNKETASILQVKQVTASMIDNLQDVVDTGDEAGRCARIAQQKYEEASMWAVKALANALNLPTGV